MIFGILLVIFLISMAVISDANDRVRKDDRKKWMREESEDVTWIN